MQLKPLEPARFDEVCALLSANDLPVDDLDNPAITVLGALDGAILLGVVALQACGDAGLLRSLAVREPWRSHGIAAALCGAVIELARERRYGSLWLLTTTAGDYFTRHSFVAVDRATAPEAIRATAQFASLCPSSAIVMRRALG